MKKITTLSLVIFSLVLASLAIAAEVNLTTTSKNTTATVSSTPVFTRSLTVGSYGQDVMALKKILGLELGATLDTSPSFTANTAIFVKKLQEKYAIEILIPSGLSAGTGVVGQTTITKLNTLASKYFVNLSDFTLPVVSTVKNVFLVNLQLGSISDDVVLLKTILNSDASTALSPKNSTNIFDADTVIAVNKFQMKYASEILTPLGLTSATGYVGASTRKKLNSMVNNLVTPTQVAVTTTTKTTTTQPYNYSYDTTVTYDPNLNIDSGMQYAASGTRVSSTCVGTSLKTIYNDGTGGTYSVTKPFSTDGNCYRPSTKITNFNLNLSAKTTSVINEANKTITVYVPPTYTLKYTMIGDDEIKSSNPEKTIGVTSEEINSLPIDLTKVTPTFNIPANSSANPASGQTVNLTSAYKYNASSSRSSNYVPFNYTVVAQDGSTSTYSVIITPIVCYDYMKYGLYFSSDNIEFAGGPDKGSKDAVVHGYNRPLGAYIKYKNNDNTSDWFIMGSPLGGTNDTRPYWITATIADMSYIYGDGKPVADISCSLPDGLKSGQQVDIKIGNNEKPTYDITNLQAIGLFNPSINMQRNTCPGYWFGTCDKAGLYGYKMIQYDYKKY